jgi:hypothetical protein
MGTRGKATGEWSWSFTFISCRDLECLVFWAIILWCLGMTQAKRSRVLGLSQRWCVQVVVCWVVTLRSVVVGYRRFGGPCCLHLQYCTLQTFIQRFLTSPQILGGGEGWLNRNPLQIRTWVRYAHKRRDNACVELPEWTVRGLYKLVTIN